MNWECPECDNCNLLSSSSCMVCNNMRPAKAGSLKKKSKSSSYTVGKYSQEESQWTCLLCNMANLSITKKCTLCNSARTELKTRTTTTKQKTSATKPSIWTCPVCHVDNPTSKIKCLVCDCLCPAPEMPLEKSLLHKKVLVSIFCHLPEIANIGQETHRFTLRLGQSDSVESVLKKVLNKLTIRLGRCDFVRDEFALVDPTGEIANGPITTAELVKRLCSGKQLDLNLVYLHNKIKVRVVYQNPEYQSDGSNDFQTMLMCEANATIGKVLSNVVSILQTSNERRIDPKMFYLTRSDDNENHISTSELVDSLAENNSLDLVLIYLNGKEAPKQLDLESLGSSSTAMSTVNRIFQQPRSPRAYHRESHSRVPEGVLMVQFESHSVFHQITVKSQPLPDDCLPGFRYEIRNTNLYLQTTTNNEVHDQKARDKALININNKYQKLKADLVITEKALTEPKNIGNTSLLMEQERIHQDIRKLTINSNIGGGEGKSQLCSMEYTASITKLEYELKPGYRSIIKLTNYKIQEDHKNHQLVIVEWLPVLSPNRT